MTILERIVVQTKEDISARRRKVAATDFASFPDYERKRKSLFSALKRSVDEPVRVIAEIKKASPSKGVIRTDFDPVNHAESYQTNGAAALSVLTDVPFFQGHPDFLLQVSRQARVPVLRKDFIVDPYQIEEARAIGADAVLLIATILSAAQLQELHHAASEIGLECLVECYAEDDFSRLDYDQVRIVGVNNRDLNTFVVDVHRGIELLTRVPADLVTVSESGLSSNDDLRLLKESGIDAALIGEFFMKHSDPGAALAKMLDSSKSEH
jgi:indole-3-glycerol phosphate synthase